MAAVVERSHVDLESGGAGGGGSHHLHSAGTSDSGSSRFRSADGSSYEEHRASSQLGTEITGVTSHKTGVSSASDCSVEVDLEIDETKAQLEKTGKDCRICHLSLDASNQESGAPIELGCSCKDDLAAAHKQCAETWFKIRGNKTCEICGSIAHNVTGAFEVELVEQWNEEDAAAAVAATASVPLIETRRFWQGHRFLNFLLACMVFAFVISWLFHFNVPS